MDPLGDLMAWAAPLGLAGLLAIGAVERIIPILPSYGLLVAIGIGAADGLWPAPLAILAVTLGGTAACLACYSIVMSMGEAMARRVLQWSARILGLSPGRVAQWVEACQDRQVLIAFGAQLVPTIRLVTPAMAGILRAEPRAFLLATAAGIAAWNGLFIGVGFVAAQVSSDINVSSLALKLLVGLIVTEATVVLLWRRHRRAAAGPAPLHPLQDHAP
ncbi:DedA family protein [Muricoccus pecuniae]|uniref:Membrane protein DedA with SNARE-associated domain n=1 Tax=Muricoccus pecuniae TaxID=693023 RepID=A0A840Y5K8_9PROT|nr:VTT domain-containing protein [Roseomonas pecuniae]MBB5696428.1 membrane protein DedA with SNARE-associated domain [Roseomonas pecuniae]